MPNMKKYTAQEAALAVLRKANELFKESSLVKSEISNENEIGTKFDKNKDLSKNEGPENNIEKQPAPQNNPAEQKENGNPLSGAIPGNGVMKLMYFMGHMHSKKKHKKVGV